MQINVSYLSGVTSQSAAFQAQFMAATNAAVQFYEHTFTNNVTVNVTMDYAALGPNAVAQNSFGLLGFYSYASVKAALASHSTSADDALAIANLPLADPGNATNGYVLTTSQAQALGLTASVGTDALTLNNSLNFTFDPNNRSAAGTYDAIGAIEHELSEGIFGHFQNLNADNNHSNSALDLFRFTAAGTDTRTYVPSADGWFSIDGVHNLIRYNNSSVQGGDYADWYPSIVGDSYGNGYSGVAGLVTPTDLRVLDVLGWNRAPATVQDFNGNGVSDILFTNPTNGDLGYYNLNGANQGWAHISGASTAYTIVGTGDFNHDYTSDILYRNLTNGDLGFYAMSNGGSGTGSGNTPGNDLAGTLGGWVHIGGTNLNYSVVGVGDFDGNGVSDILFRNNSTGDIGYYYQSGGSYSNWGHIGGSATSYGVVGVGDFMGNGTTDILFRNASTGDFGFYKMSGGASLGWVGFGGSAVSYNIVGIGDFYGVGSGQGGTSDILFRNDTTGDMGFFTVTNGVLGAWHGLGATSAAYTVVAVGDYLGNGTDDILMRNTSTGDLGYYTMSNGVNTGWHSLGGTSTAYNIVGDTTSNGVAVGEAPTAAAAAAGLSQTLGGPSTAIVAPQTLGGPSTAAPLAQTLGTGDVGHLTQTLGTGDVAHAAAAHAATDVVQLTQALVLHDQMFS